MIKEQLKAASYSILGDRPTQQDAAGMEWADESLFVAVCDGMGGMQGGEFASTTGITTIADAFRSQRPSEENKTPEWLHKQFDEADRAIDLNPQQNPYVWYNSSGQASWSHQNANAYIDRSCGDPHVIVQGDTCYNIFTKYGFSWGGLWGNPIDYQHFEKKAQ